MNFKTKKKLIEHILSMYPATRNSDNLLIVCYLEYFHGISRDKTSFIMDLPESFFETTRRVRQKIQNTEGRFVPTDAKIAMKRRMNMDVWKKALGYHVKSNSGQMELM